MTEIPVDQIIVASGAGRSEAELVALARDRSEAAYAEIIRRHNRRLFRIARSILKNDAEAEDAVQDAYVQVFRHLERLRDEASLSGWLARIAVTEALGRLRRRRPTVTLDEVDGAMEDQDSNMTADPLAGLRPQDPEASAARREVRAVLEQAVDRLPTHFRMVFVACAVEQMSIEEAAACLGLPANTVKTRFHRAKRRLRQELGAELAATLADTFPFGGVHCERMTARVLARLADLTREARG